MGMLVNFYIKYLDSKGMDLSSKSRTTGPVEEERHAEIFILHSIPNVAHATCFLNCYGKRLSV